MRKWKDSTGREVCDLEIVPGKYDGYIGRAFYLDDGSEVPEDELEWIAKGECLCADCLEAS